MNICIVCSKKIKDKQWIETQLIDCFYEIFLPKKILLLKEEMNGGNSILREILASKYDLEEFSSSWEEFGIGAIEKRNIDMLAKTNLLIAFHDGQSRSVNNCIQIALRKKLPMNIRYFPSKF